MGRQRDSGDDVSRKFAPLFSSASPHHATPPSVYEQLDREFHFDFDPCPLHGDAVGDGLTASWVGRRVFCNPPYGPGIEDWLAKAREAVLAVFLLPARTDTRWWHEFALKADEIRFVRGRLKFGDAKNGPPFPSLIFVYR